jgi:hypothetical protein
MVFDVVNDRVLPYHPKRDGALEEYLKAHNGFTCMPLFKGYGQYKMLWDKGYLQPRVSVIRLMWNVGRGDEHFIVTKDNRLEGCTGLEFHSGRPGIHDPKVVLSARNCPVWEAQHLNRKPTPRG